MTFETCCMVMFILQRIVGVADDGTCTPSIAASVSDLSQQLHTVAVQTDLPPTATTPNHTTTETSTTTTTCNNTTTTATSPIVTPISSLVKPPAAFDSNLTAAAGDGHEVL